jgi:hypothetical protein
MDTGTRDISSQRRGFLKTAGVTAFFLCLFGASGGFGEAAAASWSMSSVRPTAPPFLLVSGQILANNTILALIPRCDNLKPLREPVAFPWTNFSKRVKELSKAEWGYFSCPQSAPTVSSFYRGRMTKPPYVQGETNWIVRREGTLGVYYSYATGEWLYLWVVPKPGEANMSLVVVAKSGGMLVNCRLRTPSIAPGDGWRAE